MSTGPVYEVTHGQLFKYALISENEVKRELSKASYDLATIKDILQQVHFVNVAFVDEDGHPQCIPMVHAIEESEDTLYVYIHGYHRARIMRLLPPESRVCVTATVLTGLALALSAFESSINHRTAVLHGQIVDWDEDAPSSAAAKWDAGRQIVQHVMPGRWADCRQPTQSEMATTGFLKIKVLSASAKCSDGPPGEKKQDLQDEVLVGKTWAGVVPVSVAYGTPQPSDFVKAPVPSYIQEYVSNPGVYSG